MAKVNPGPSLANQYLVAANHHHLAGRLPEAEAGYIDVLRLQPKNPDALHYLGVIRTQQRNYAEAIKLITRAIKERPNAAEMHSNLGTAYRRSGDAVRAIYAYRKAIALQPSLAVAHFDLGHALRDAKDFDAALKEYQIYLKDRPEDPVGLAGLAHAYAGLGRHNEAMTAFDLAITFDPDFAEAYNKIGAFLCDRGQYQTAVPFHEKAVALAPTVPEWTFDYAIAQLRLEHFAEGWAAYESRCDREHRPLVRKPAPPAYWRNEDLQGKTILIWMEQGLGDQILFSSILPALIARARHCIVECAPRLVPVFARSFPTAEIRGNDDTSRPISPADEVDYQIAAGSMGQYLRPDRQSFPRHDGYLAADAAAAGAMRARYLDLAKGRRVVGLSWRTRNVAENESKSIDLTDLASILRTPGVMFVNLQYGDCRTEIDKAKKLFGVEILEDPAVDPLRDMDAFFAQVAAMDLVVTTSNTTAHVAGAQNKPVWIMLSAVNSLMWYWFVNRPDSPWYPSACLIRPSTIHGAEPWHQQVVATAAARLRKWLEAAAPSDSAPLHAAS